MPSFQLQLKYNSILFVNSQKNYLLMRWHNTATERHRIQNLSQQLMPLCLSDSMTGIKKPTQKYSSKNVSYKERTENE